MKPHEERVMVERNELAEKIDKLRTFLSGNVFRGLDNDEQLRLLQQFAYMRLYLDVLESRIRAFGL